LRRLWWSAFASIGAVALLLAGCGGSGPPYNATPIISNLFPSNITAGSDSFTLFVVGTGFIDDSKGVSVVDWNGSPRAAVLNQTTGQLEVQILAADVAGPNQNVAQVTVTNPAPGGGESNAAGFIIVAQQPGGPLISSLSPTSANPNGPAFTLTVNGSNFAASDVVTWNGTPRTTTFVNASQVTASISMDDISAAGDYAVAVATPGLVIASPSVNFQVGTVSNSMAVVSSVSPSNASQGSSNLEVTVSGSGFVRGAVVKWDGKPLPTAFLSDSELVVVVPAAEFAVPRTVVVGVSASEQGKPSQFTQRFVID
jgi:IPT/TIG domain